MCSHTQRSTQSFAKVGQKLYRLAWRGLCRGLPIWSGPLFTLALPLPKRYAGPECPAALPGACRAFGDADRFLGSTCTPGPLCTARGDPGCGLLWFPAIGGETALGAVLLTLL